MQKDQMLPGLAVLKESFQQGITRTLSWRRSQLRALELFLVEREKEIADAVHADFRKSAAETFLTETGYLRREIRFSLKHLASWTKPCRVSVPLLYQPAKAYYAYEPYGVVLIIGAWNYPLNLSLAPLVSVIAAGNCAVVKPSEHAPHTSSVIAEGLKHYLDRNAFCVIEGGVDVARALLAERFDYIFYTGSKAVGREVMSAAARNLTPLTLELGGKCPCIVDEHSDLRVAARRIVWGKFLNAGQTCLAPDYVLVHKKREAELLRLMRDAVTFFYGYDPMQSPDYPRIINEVHFRRIEALFSEAGGNFRFGNDALLDTGTVFDVNQRYVAPTIIEGVRPGSPLMKSEIFAPLLPVIAYNELEEALDIIRAGTEPLAVYIFSSDKDVQERVVRCSRSGGVCINDLLFQAALHTLPFGGVGGSGFGAYHGRAGFETFSFRRSVMKRAFFPDPDLRYPPYPAGKFAFLKRLFLY